MSRFLNGGLVQPPQYTTERTAGWSAPAMGMSRQAGSAGSAC